MRILFVVIVGVALGMTGCKKKPTTTPTESPPPSGVRGNSNYVAGGGAVQNVRQEAKRAVTLNDMHQIGLMISMSEIENNKMPSKNEIYSLLSQTPNLRKLIDDGDVILTGTKSREGLWAYEVDADVKGGIGLVAGVPNRYRADEIKQYLGQ
ncbi:MAG TPA: hypothetical protein VGJ05_18340 [Fimbriiglobus sp.]|jgi:hypothetical protein